MPDTVPDSLATQGEVTRKIFWDAFFARAGSGAPAVFRSDRVAHDFSIADGLQLADAIALAGDMAVNVDGKLCVNPRLPGGIAPSADLDEYIRQLARMNDGAAVTFTRDYCLRYSGKLSRKCGVFFSEYVQRNGIGLPGFNAVFIAGRYKETWIGLHNDFCDTFLIPLRGRKKMYLWPPDYFSAPEMPDVVGMNGVCLGKTNVTAFLHDATLLEVEEGDLLFIPAKWWHYNLLDTEETTVTLSFGSFANETVAQSLSSAVQTVVNELSNEVNERFLPPPVIGIDTLEDVPLPAHWQFFLTRLRCDLAARILRISSSRGIIATAFDLPEGIEVGSTTRIIPIPHLPVYIVTLVAEYGVVFANGQVRQVRWSQTAKALVERIASGKAFALDDICPVCVQKDGLAELVVWLAAVGAIDLA
ncbi:MAG: cupin [Massilia sp.]|nr:cupin [Massilia sp.]